MSRANDRDRNVSRRTVLKGGAGITLASTLSTLTAGVGPARADSKKVVIGAFADGGLTPFKEKIIPLAKEQGFDVTFLEDEYSVTLEKWFADAQSGAGQYDLYLLDDPWVPQFGAAGILEDLGAAGVDGNNKDWIKPLIDMGYWPPREGPRVKGFETAKPTLVTVPFVGDLQTLTYRNDVYTERRPGHLGRCDREGQGGGRRREDQVSGRVPRRRRATRSSQAGIRSSCRSAASSSTTSGTADLQLRQGQGGGRVLCRRDEAERASRRGRVRLRPGGRGNPRRRRRRDHPILGQCAEVGRSDREQGGGQARLRRGAEEGEGHRPARHLHRGRAEIGAATRRTRSSS